MPEVDPLAQLQTQADRLVPCSNVGCNPMVTRLNCISCPAVLADRVRRMLTKAARETFNDFIAGDTGCPWRSPEALAEALTPAVVAYVESETR